MTIRRPARSVTVMPMPDVNVKSSKIKSKACYRYVLEMNEAIFLGLCRGVERHALTGRRNGASFETKQTLIDHDAFCSGKSPNSVDCAIVIKLDHIKCRS